MTETGADANNKNDLSHSSLQHLQQHDIEIGNDKKSKNGNEGYFEWKDISFSIGERQILKGISGRLPHGQLLGILGGSGAGKSTFLNSISGRLVSDRNKKVGGSIAWKGLKYDIGHSSSIKTICAYVMQNDILCPTQTAREALEFSAFLRLPKTMSYEEKKQRVDKIINDLKLNKCENTYIGNDAIRGVSGGEKKRINCGIELITDPDLIFLDEPTSGLDSYTAMKTLEILKSLTLRGKQVVATIHQPSSEIFNLLDQLLLLCEGNCVYFGPTKNVIDYFNKINYPIPQYTNPADFVINRIQENGNTFIENWKLHQTDSNVSVDFTSYNQLIPHNRTPVNILTQSKYLLLRELHIFTRDPRPSRLRLAQSIIFGIIVGILYYKLPNTTAGLRDRFGAIFFVTINSSLLGLVSTILTFPEQRLLFEKERDNQMYPTWVYYANKTLIQIPEQLFFAVIYLLICYWMVLFKSSFIEFYVSLSLGMLSSGSLGLIMGIFSNNVGEAMQFLPIAFIPLILFANFLVSLDQIPVWIRWIQWIDLFKYVIDALCITEYRNIPNGESYLDFINVNQDNLAFDWYLLFILFAGFRILGLGILIYRNGW